MTTFINTDYGYGNRELNLYPQDYSLLTDLYQLIIRLPQGYVCIYR